MSSEIDTVGRGLSPEMKETLKQHIEKIKGELDKLAIGIDSKGYCILCEFEQIDTAFREVQTVAATYYLKAYLAPFTENYLAITLAIQHLSLRKQGALIVVQRNDTLDELIHSGIFVGATLSHSLLESIFYPGGPLHDGAVLVQSNRIISAGNVLPLSKIPHRDSKLGTRHRAAIGLTEHSDAVVIVVSEETGRASFAIGGQLYPFSSNQFHT